MIPNDAINRFHGNFQGKYQRQNSLQIIAEVLGETPECETTELVEVFQSADNAPCSQSNCDNNLNLSAFNQSESTMHSGGYYKNIFVSPNSSKPYHTCQPADVCCNTTGAITSVTTPCNPGKSPFTSSYYTDHIARVKASNQTRKRHQSEPIPLEVIKIDEDLKQKKLKNNEACRMSRVRSKERKIEMERKIRHLGDENQKLRLEIYSLEREIAKTKETVFSLIKSAVEN